MKNFTYIFKFCLMIMAFFVALTLSVSADTGKNKSYAEKYITESLKLQLDRMSVYEFHLSESELFEIIDRVMKTNPNFYYVENKFYYTADATGVVREITPVYLYSAEEVRNIRSFCDNEIEKILFSVDDSMSDLQKVLTLHEYMCENFRYDDSFESGNMYDMLRTGKGTCQAFTLTYMELLSRIGVESSYAYSDEIMHIWNLVKLDGEWYHVDLTWDNVSPSVSHKNFLLTDAEAIRSGHAGLVNAEKIECKGGKYSALSLRESPYRYVPFKDGFIYVDNISRSVYFDRLDGGEKICLYRIDDLWEKGEGRYFANTFSMAISAGDKVYFNTKNKIMQIDSELSVSVVCHLGFTSFGIEQNNGVQCYLDRRAEESVKLEIPISFDADGDGEVTVLDVAALDAYLLSEDAFIYKYNVDANADRLIGREDLWALERHLLIDKSA